MTDGEIQQELGRLAQDRARARTAHETARLRLRRKAQALKDIGEALLSDPDSVPFPRPGFLERSPILDALIELSELGAVEQLEQLARDERAARERLAALNASAERAGL